MQTHDRRSGRRCGAFLSLAVAATLAPLAGPASAQQNLTPDTSVRGPVLELDFPEIHIGIAEYAEGPTGATVFYFPDPVKAAIDVRGGAPGVTGAEPLRLQRESAFTNAITFAGGSNYGLTVAAGVAEGLKEQWIEAGEWKRIADVTGAIIFDLGNRRLNTVTPDAVLGRAALGAAKPGSFPLGAQGAGRFAMQGGYFGPKQHSGQGAAFRQVGQTKVAVFTVVNAGGTIVDRDGNIVRCGRDDIDDCGTFDQAIKSVIEAYFPAEKESAVGGTTSNTTLTLVVTNEQIPILELQRLAIEVHGSMSRAIQPFNTISDGDVLIAVTTGQVKTEAPYFYEALGVLAADVAWDAVLASVPELPESGPTDPVRWPAAKLDEVVGEYRFSRWATLRIERDGDTLRATGPNRDNYYFPVGETVELTPVSDDELIIQSEHAHRLRVERKGGRVVALTLEPGPWGQRAVCVAGPR